MQGDLISRSAARELVRKAARYVVVIPETGRGYDGAVLIDEIMHEFNKLPAVDAVPVVRCRECKRWGLPEGMYATENIKHCEFGRYMVASDGYCVYGEVKNNELE